MEIKLNMQIRRRMFIDSALIYVVETLPIQPRQLSHATLFR